MAEAIGTIASGVGVASFVVQVANGIKKFTDFCNAVKDAPSDIQDIVQELEDLSDLYHNIGDQYSEQLMSVGLSQGNSLGRILARARRNVDDLAKITQDGEADIRKKKTRASIKFVLRAQTLTKFKTRVQRARDSLSLSFALFCNVLRLQEHQTTLDNLKELAKLGSSIENHVSRSSSSLTTSSLSSLQNPQQTFTWSKRKKDETLFGPIRLRVPTWLSYRTWELRVSQSSGGWMSRLRCYNIVPSNSPLFQACSSGEVEVVKDILSSRKGSVFDEDENGMTPLHYAVATISDGTVEVCQVLLHYGADVNACDKLSKKRNGIKFRTPLWHLGYVPGYSPYMIFSLFRHQDLHFDMAETVVTLTKMLASRMELEMEFDDYVLLLVARQRPPEATRSIQQMICPTWLESPPEERITMLFRYPLYPGTRTLGDLDSILGFKLLEKLDHFSNEFRDEMFTKLVLSYAVLLAWEYDASIIGEWRALLRAWITDGCDLHACANHCLSTWSSLVPSIMGRFVLWYSIVRKRLSETDSRAAELSLFQCYNILEQALQYFLEELVLLEIDLVCFGAKEMRSKRLTGSASWFGLSYGNKLNKCCVRIISFNYGPRPCDWHLWLSNPLDEWAGEFWDMIEHPERALPGAWLEEEE